MSIRNKPNYGLYPISLSNAGFMDLPVIGSRIIMVAAVSGATFSNVAGVSILSGGTPAPSTIVNVQVGRALGDPVPFGINTKISVDDSFDFVRLSWAAQNNVTAFFIIDDDREGAGIAVDAPSSTLGGSIAIQQGGNTAAVDAGGALRVASQFETAPSSRALGQLGASFFEGTMTGALQTLLAPGSNVNGVIVRFAEMIQNTGESSTIFADTAAPSGPADFTKRWLKSGSANPTAALTREVFLPAGIGLYVFSSAAGGQVQINYDIL